MKQMARNLVDPVEGFLRGATHLIHDRDPLFTEWFTAVLKSGGAECVKIPARSPKCNPHAERFVKTIKYECLNQCKHPVLSISRGGPARGSMEGTRWMARRKFPTGTMPQLSAAC